MVITKRGRPSALSSCTYELCINNPEPFWRSEGQSRYFKRDFAAEIAKLDCSSRVCPNSCSSRKRISLEELSLYHTLMTTRRVFLREDEDADNNLNETLDHDYLYDQKNLDIPS